MFLHSLGLGGWHLTVIYTYLFIIMKQLAKHLSNINHDNNFSSCKLSSLSLNLLTKWMSYSLGNVTLSADGEGAKVLHITKIPQIYYSLSLNISTLWLICRLPTVLEVPLKQLLNSCKLKVPKSLRRCAREPLRLEATWYRKLWHLAKPCMRKMH